MLRFPYREASKSVGSNGEIVLRLKGERAFEVDVWTFNRRCRATLTPRILVLTYGVPSGSQQGRGPTCPRPCRVGDARRGVLRAAPRDAGGKGFGFAREGRPYFRDCKKCGTTEAIWSEA